MKIKDTNQALLIFEEASHDHATATETGDFKTANRSYHRVTAAAAFLKERNELQMLEKYLSVPATGPRLWAAYCLLTVNEKKAESVLQVIAGTSGILSFVAETTLSEWKKGNLKS
jgi:Domain of unknown function (DUF2019)